MRFRLAVRRSSSLLPAALAGLALACGGAGAGTPTPAAPAPAPQATMQPARASVVEGANQSFTAVFNAAAPGGLQWTATGGSITTQGAAGTQASGTFTAGTMPGTYTVSLSENGVGTLATATVVVTAPPVQAPPPPPAPTATLSPASLNVAAGATATLTASVANLDPSLLVWSATGGSVQAGTPSGGNVQAVYTAGAAAGSFQVSVAAPGGGAALATAAVTVTAAAAPPSQPAGGTRLFPNAAADWLYTAPSGSGIDISSVTSGITFQVNAHDTGFDYPVVTTDGTHGCTTFTDTLQYAFTDKICVPNPANGYYPSVGGWGANDGHLIVLNTATGDYYDFWKLYTSNGVPNSTNVGGIFHGNVSGNGTPGTTAANITGLAGDILPGELDCDTCLNHALNIVVPSSMNSNLVGHQSPATKTDGGVSGGVFREGAKLRFDPSIDVSKLQASTAAKAILRALQLYGGVITDQTGGANIGIYSALPTAPDLSGLQQAGAHMFIYY